MRRNVKLPLGVLEKNATSHDAVSADRKGGLNRRALLSGGAVLPVLPSFLLGNTPRAAGRLFHFSEWICISQNFSDRRARAAKGKGQG